MFSHGITELSDGLPKLPAVPERRPAGWFKKDHRPEGCQKEVDVVHIVDLSITRAL
jgi:hypothetical protein